jgi:GntR family transcriptional regulator / MocR family aminotransferase
VSDRQDQQQKIIAELLHLVSDCQFRPGDSLPSVRELARRLGSTRSTVHRAIEALRSQGYVESRAGSGNYVNNRFRGISNRLRPETDDSPAEQLSGFAKQLLAVIKGGADKSGSCVWPGQPDMSILPFAQWRELLEHHCRYTDLSVLARTSEPLGYLPLRQAYAAYLRRVRGLNCDAQQVAVFSGRELRLDMICRLLLNHGDYVAVEDPSYPDMRLRMGAFGAGIVPIPVDEDGMDVGQLIATKLPIKLVYCAPSNNEPRGTAMSTGRRLQLLDWADRTGAFIVEDDYNSEFRSSGPLLTSLQGMDDSDSVFYLSCLWNVLFPMTKLGFLVIPRCLIETFTRAKMHVECDMPALDQLVLTDFINNGCLDRQVRRARRLYARRRSSLIDHLQEVMGDHIQISMAPNGMDLLVYISKSSQDVLEVARQCELAIFSTQSYYARDACANEFIIPFACTDEEMLRRKVSKFAELYTTAGGGAIANSPNSAQVALSL